MGVLLVLVFMMGSLSVGKQYAAHNGGGKSPRDARAASVVEGERAEKRQRSRRERSMRTAESRRAAELKVLLAAYHPQWQSDDPFASMPIGASEVARLYAWVIQTELSEYPDVMGLIKKASVNGQDNDQLEALLLARWAELDPDGALQWATERESTKEGGDVLEVQMNLAREALPYHPEWAVAMTRSAALEMIEEYKRGKRSDDPFGDDPFGTNYFNLDLDAFYQRLAILFPGQRESLKNKLGEEMFGYGQDGWYRGVAQSLGADGLEALAQITRDPETGLIDSGAFAVIAEQDWKRAQRWLEQHGSNDDLDSTVFHHARVEDFEKAADWYLSRSADLGERAARVYDVFQKIDGYEGRVAWLEQMEAKGEPVNRAWSDMVAGLISGGAIDKAMQHMPKVPADAKADYMKRIYKQASEGHYFYGKEGSVDYYTLKENDMAFIQANPECREYIRNANREAMEKFKELLHEVELQLDGR